MHRMHAVMVSDGKRLPGLKSTNTVDTLAASSKSTVYFNARAPGLDQLGSSANTRTGMPRSDTEPVPGS